MRYGIMISREIRRIVDVHISHLREKIEKDTKKPLYIKTIRGLGYKLEEPKKE